MKMRKARKVLALLLVLALALGLLPAAALDAGDVTVYVSAVEDGRFVTGRDGRALAWTPVAVGGPAPSVGDALAALRERYADGSDADEAAWDPGLVDVYLNNSLVLDLNETVEDGDVLCCFLCRDAGAGPDVRARFDRTAAAAAQGAPLELTLTAAGEGGSPLAGAAVTVDGVWAGGAVTDGNGKVILTFDRVGVHLVSAAAPGGGVRPVCVVRVEREKTDDRARMETLMANIAAYSTENFSDWMILDMAAYAALGIGDAQTSDAAKQACLDTAIARLLSGQAGDAACARAILALTAIGVDAARLFPAGSADAFSAVDGLNAAVQSPGAWSAPYTLAAYNQGSFHDTDPYEAILIDAILDAQGEDGSWSEENGSVRATASMIAGLAFYREVNPAAAAAIGRALDYLSAAQGDDGSFDDSGRGPDAETAALVVIALAAAGVDPDGDPRFIKFGVSALDGLLDFAYADGGGFGYQSGERGEDDASVARATELAFRALIAAYPVVTTGRAYNVYDFSGTAVAPGFQTAGGLKAGVKKTDVTVPGATFPDIAGRADQTAIEALARREILNGKDSGLFDPDAEMTRAEFAAAVVRALGLEPRACDEFSDVGESDWFAPYVGTAWRCGIVSGRGDGVFAPLDTITRQEAAAMVARAAVLCGLDTALTDDEILGVLEGFGDADAVAAWARPSVAFCYSAGILDRSGWNVEPVTNIRRCEVAEMLFGLLESAGLL